MGKCKLSESLALVLDPTEGGWSRMTPFALVGGAIEGAGTLVDNFTRESLAIEVDRSLGAGRLPEDLLVATEPESADAVIAFVRNLTELGTSASPAVDAALRDAIAYIAYPKAGQLVADLNRDVLNEAARVVGSRRGDRMKIKLMKTITHLRKFP